MRGIAEQKARVNSVRYRKMYKQWTESKTTLEELTYAKLVERDAAMTEAAMGVKGKIPYPVPIVLG